MEDKSKNTIIYFLILIILILSIIICVMVVKNDSSPKDSDNTKIEEKNANKESNKQENKEDEEAAEEEEDETPEINTYEVTKEEKQHNGCAVCDEEGDICCGTGPEVTTDILTIDVKDKNFVTDSLVMASGYYKYTVKYTRNNYDGKIIVNGKTIFNTSLIVGKIFVLDNGMIGIEYYDDMNQALLKNRVYFDSNLNKINTFEGLKANQYVLDKVFEYTEFSNECINNEYREYKVYKATIGDKTIDTKMLKKDKEYNCAGMT